MSIGLALSGGGAKGIAHIGVLQALEENGIKIDYISGCSSGSIVASLYAAGFKPKEILDVFVKNCNNIIDYDGKIGLKLLGTVFTKKLSIKGFVKGNKLEKTIRFYLKTKGIVDISEVKQHLAIPVVNLQTGETVYFSNGLDKEVVLCSMNNNTYKENEGVIQTYGNKSYDDMPTCFNCGELADIVRASCSFPGVFMPKEIEDTYYIDGGVRVNTPVKVLKQMGADKVIAVTFNCNNKLNVGINNIVGVSEQAFNILTHNSNTDEQKLADVNIRLCFKNVSLLDFSKAIHLAQRGYNIVNRNIKEIKALLEKE
ncbi:MAG: patatin-like phospholipase family protein [Clostridia bacterium]|nr:patatin-like phospholipase family protein [Clostridia bacterium]